MFNNNSENYDVEEGQIASRYAFFKQYYKNKQTEFEELYSVKSPSTIFEFLRIYNRMKIQYNHIPHLSMILKHLTDFEYDYYIRNRNIIFQVRIFNWSKEDEDSLRYALEHIKQYVNADYALKVHFQGDPALAA